MRTLVGIVLLLSVASGSNARLLSVYPQIADIPSAPAGYVVNQIKVDFEGMLRGQQMIVQLDSGSLFNHPLGGETPPDHLLLPMHPGLAADTFVMVGGLTDGASQSVLVIGGSTEFPESSGVKLFDDTGIDIAWAPSPGVIVTDQTGYTVAQLTLSEDATGAIEYYGNGEHWQGFENGFQLMIHSGVVYWGERPIADPEPSSALLASVALLGVAVRRPDDSTRDA